MSYKDSAIEIDRFLRQNGIMTVQKSDLVAKFGLHSDKRTAVYSILKSLGWEIRYSHLERRN